MVKYSCEKCGKEFTQKGQYNKHTNIKKPCVFVEEINDTLHEHKKELGQFYTTNYTYILQNMYIPDDIVEIIEPFAGNGDLLKFIDNQQNQNQYNIRCYDIDPKQEYIVKQDTLLNPPNFDGAFVISNPPYLARNKCKDKTLFDKYNTNDLYKCFIQILIQSNCKGGILIVPLNFISSIRASDIELRQKFIKKYDVVAINIFEERVFDDTSYTICSFQFKLNSTCEEEEVDNKICGWIYPENKKINFVLNAENNYTIGGEIYNLPQNTSYKIERATKASTDPSCFTNILIKCIDDSNESRIKTSIVNDDIKKKYIDNTPNLTARSFAILVVEPKLDMKQQEQLVEKFNAFLNKHREKYNSLFLTNYRESNTIARKRISFGLVYEICNYLLQ
jgi:hypothetical protein